MFDTVNRKKDIYDKRPEDHPQYPEEWRIFWEKRYKDLQAQGKDADNYDYKPDWIPYWAKKSEELYHEEIHIKTRDLLEKYGLKTGDEPNREQYMREFERKGRFNGYFDPCFGVKKCTKQFANIFLPK